VCSCTLVLSLHNATLCAGVHRHRRALLALAPPLALAALTVPDAGAVTAAVNREKYEYMPALEQSDFGKARVSAERLNLQLRVWVYYLHAPLHSSSPHAAENYIPGLHSHCDRAAI